MNDTDKRKKKTYDLHEMLRRLPDCGKVIIGKNCVVRKQWSLVESIHFQFGQTAGKFQECNSGAASTNAEWGTKINAVLIAVHRCSFNNLNFVLLLHGQQKFVLTRYAGQRDGVES